MTRIKIGSNYYTESEIIKKINNLKRINTEKSKENNSLKGRVKELKQSSHLWRTRYKKLVDNMKILIRESRYE